MQIKLKRTGGVIPVKKEAVTDTDWSDAELQQLLSVIKRTAPVENHGRDLSGYSLEVNEKSTPVDIDKVPAAYKKVFEKLIASLKPVKF